MKLGKRAIDAVPAPAVGELRVWDTEVKGFCLRVHATGRKVYVVKYRVGREQRWFTIGKTTEVTPDEARALAREVLRSALKGDDLATEKKAKREALTVAELIDRYLEDGPATKPDKRPSTWREDGSNLNRHVRPLLGRKVVNRLVKADLARMVHAVRTGETAVDEKTKARGRARVRGGEAVARRTLTVAAAMFAWGEEHGLSTGIPTRSVKLPTPKKSERFLSADEAHLLLRSIAELESEGALNPLHGAVFRLLLLTGARKSEVSGLCWSEVDFVNSRLTLPPERTKAGGKTGERRVHLNTIAVGILQNLKRDAEKEESKVFPASRGSGSVVGLQKAWTRVRSRASLGDVRIHDLRHSFASFAIADGSSLYMVSKALGHSGTRVTERYAHVAADPLLALAEGVGQRFTIVEGLGGVAPRSGARVDSA